MTTIQTNNQPNSRMVELVQKDTYTMPEVGAMIEGVVVSSAKNEVHLDIDGVFSGVVRGPELFDESGEFSNLTVGDPASATVLEIENENGQFELSFRTAGHLKAWQNLQELLAAQKVVEATIMDANKGGLIIKVGNVSGFLPVSQLAVEHYPRVEGGNKTKILERLQEYIGTVFTVKVIDVNESDNKLIVSEKKAKAEQQEEKIAQYNVGDEVEGRITGVVDFGAFVEFGEGLEGLVHISEIAWQRIDNPGDFLDVGQEVKAQIISIDDSKLSLSIRNLVEDPWAVVAKKYDIGEVVTGTVLKINPFGAFVELDNDIHGLAHISELSYRKLSSPAEVLKEGEETTFKIISIEPKKHRLGLSYKALHEEPTGKDAAAKETKAKAEEPKEETANDAEEKKEDSPAPEVKESADAEAMADKEQANTETAPAEETATEEAAA